VALDRFGPRRVEAFLLLFAGLGAWVFATAESPAGLMAGRALIGFGVSACLMAAFTGYVMWFPRQRLPLINGIQVAFGGLGALAATVPVEAALSVMDWRGVFRVLGVLTFGAAEAVFVMVPEGRPGKGGIRLGEQLKGIRAVFADPRF